MRERERAQRADGVDEQRMRTVEGMDEPAVLHWRPATRLHRAADLQRQLVEADFPIVGVDLAFARQPPERAVGADVVEAVIVDAHVRQMRRHAGDRALTTEFEKLPLAGCVELQQGGAVLEAFGPFRPSTRGVAAFDGKDGSAARQRPRLLE